MGRKSRIYTKIDDADVIVKGLCENQPDVLWCVRPETIAVMGIENCTRSEKNHTLAKIKPVKGTEKAIFQINNIPIRYIIECYWADWNLWNNAQRQWIILHELLHVHPEFEKTIPHDCEDFKIILDRVGVSWMDKKDLPDLMNKDTKFNLELRPSLNLDDEDDDEIKDKKDKKGKKADKKDEAVEEIEEEKEPTAKGDEDGEDEEDDEDPEKDEDAI